MQELNAFTLIVSHIFLTAAISILLIIASLAVRSEWPKGWIAANLTHLAAFLLFPFQVTGNLFLGVVVANCFFVYSTTLVADVSVSLLRSRFPKQVYPAVLIPTLFVTLLFAYVVSSAAAQAFLVTVLSSAPLIVALIIVLPGKSRAWPGRFVVMILAAMIVSLWARSLFDVVRPENVVGIAERSDASAYAVVGSTLMILGWNAGILILLLNKYHYRLLEQAHSRAEIGRELQELHVVTPGEGGDIKTVTARSVSLLRNRLGFDMAALFLYNEDESALELIDSAGVPPALQDMIRTVDLATTINGASLTTGRAIVRDIVNDYPDIALREELVTAGITSLAAVPIKTLEGPIGSLSIGVAGGLDRLKEELPLLEHLGTEIGVALHGYKLTLRLKTSEANYRTVFDLAADAMFVFDSEGHLLDVNRESPRRLGYSREELLQMNITDIDPTIHPRNLFSEITERSMQAQKSVETMHHTCEGSTIPTWVNTTPIQFNGKSAILAVARDITERKQFEAELERLALFDPLTGIANRRAFDRRLVEELERAERNGYLLALAMLDIDNFKLVNDNHGHAVGDIVLKEIVRIVQNSLRKIDFIARYGGEEFVVLLLDTNVVDAERILDALRLSIDRHVFDEKRARLHCTVSIGVAANQTGDSPEAFLERADAQLYRAKGMGKNCVCR